MGSLGDVEHVVILMQENRSFDHYYGTMRGTRGFGDRAVARGADGRDLFHQPDPARGQLLPFHADTSAVNGQELGELDHTWAGTHRAWDDGRYTDWVEAKTPMTMAYYTEADIPFQRALAGEFTLCDHYFCSLQGPTTPNRLYLWTGTVDAQGRAGGPAIDNVPNYAPAYLWTTYPERLQAAGVTWQVYANDEIGDDTENHPFVGDYGDNSLWLFQAYHESLSAGGPVKRELSERAGLKDSWRPDSGLGRSVEHALAPFIEACRTGELPQVSWIVAPYGYSEHPKARPVDGAAYTAGVLNAIWSNPRLWESTVVFIDYDENDGFFDHIPPPVPPPGTPDEFVDGVPIGLGPRVPMTVVSPWSRGGWIDSEVFDHTSVIRFLEKWTGVHEPNISAWRRRICGDLTSCFDFSRRDVSVPALPDTAALRRQADARDRHLPAPRPPETQHMPVQDPGIAPARPLPYQPMANLDAGTVRLTNSGTVTVPLSVRTAGRAHPVDIDPDATAEFVVETEEAWVHGPNGFLRHFSGVAGVEVAVSALGAGPMLRIRLANRTSRTIAIEVTDRLQTSNSRRIRLPAEGESTLVMDPFGASYGWYDLDIAIADRPDFVRSYAGHLENGTPSVTG